MTLDFDLEAETAKDLVRKFAADPAEYRNGEDLIFFARKILKGLNPTVFALNLVALAAVTGKAVEGEAPPELGIPPKDEITLDYLRGLDDAYFGKPVPFCTGQGHIRYFSLEREGQDVYVRCIER